jgi:hypothetical protein
MHFIRQNCQDEKIGGVGHAAAVPVSAPSDAWRLQRLPLPDVPKVPQVQQVNAA